ncbi:hypothetical protein [Streptomyces sp. NPDC058249]
MAAGQQDIPDIPGAHQLRGFDQRGVRGDRDDSFLRPGACAYAS